MTFEKIYKQIEDIDGWMGRADCKVLYEYARKVEGTIVEIGSYLGRSTKLLALSSPKSKVVAIDSYDKERFATISDEESPIVERTVDNTKNKFLQNVEGLSVTLIAKPSRVAGRGWKTPIDFLHIDGSHLYKDVKQDIKLFVPHVKKGHYVFFHDYYESRNAGGDPEKYGVLKALNEVKDKYFDKILTHDIDYGFAICRKK